MQSKLTGAATPSFTEGWVDSVCHMAGDPKDAVNTCLSNFLTRTSSTRQS